MSDRVIQSYHDSGKRDRQPLHSYQSIWMSRWAGASCNTELQEQNQLSSPLGTDEVDHGTKQLHLPSGVEIASDISDSAKEFREVKTRNFEIINESSIMSSRNLRNDRPSSQESPITNISQKSGSSFILKNDHETNNTKVLKRQFSQNFEHGNTASRTSGTHFPSIHSVVPLETEASSRECHIQHQSLSRNPKDLVQSHMIFGSSFSFRRSSQDNFTGTSSPVFPQGLDLGEGRFDRGRSSEPSSIRRQEKVDHLRSILVSKKHLSDTNITILEQKCNYHNDSTVLVGKQKMDDCSISGKSVIPYLRKDIDSSKILSDPSRDTSHSPAICEEQDQRMHNHSGSGLSPSWSSPPAMTELETLQRGCCLHTKPSSMHDAKTMRIFTSVDSVEGVSGSRPRISQTTHSLLIKKRTDVNLCKENHIFRESGVLDHLKENPFSELHSFSPLCGHSQRAVKLGEGKENVQDVNAFEVVTKNELSAETDTMDMSNFKDNHLSGMSTLHILLTKLKLYIVYLGLKS